MDATNINNLKSAFFAKLNDRFGDVEVWRHKDYEEISLLIFEKTKFKISSSTLKRIFGNVHYGFSPSKTTLNAIAQFLDFKNWEDFVISGSPSPPISTTRRINQKFSINKKNVIVLLGCVVLVFVMLYFFVKVNSSVIDIDFNTATPIVAVPNSVEFNYDLSQIKSDSVYINFGMGNNEPIDLLSKESKSYVRNFLMPGIDKIVIHDNKKRYDSVNVLVLSHYWERYLCCPTDKGVAFSHLPSNYKSDSVLDITRKDLDFARFDTTGYIQSDFRFFDTLPILLDNFTIETRFRNYAHLKRFISCSFAALKIYSFESHIKINFTEPSCIQNAFFIIGEEQILGKKVNLKSLGIDLFVWHDIKFIVENNMATLYVNGVENMKVEYHVPIGKFCGIQFNFSMTGAVDYVRLYNEKNELIYNNDFY
jgi:hypothetical protein